MFIQSIKTALRRFWTKESGAASIEAVMMFPFLLVALTFSYEFYDQFRYKSVREKATYTVADMLSREMTVIDDNYMDNVKTLFDMMTNDDGVNQLRVSVVRYRNDPSKNIDEFVLRWSEVRGQGPLIPLSASDISQAHDTLPEMVDGQELILVDTTSRYDPTVSANMTGDTVIKTRMFLPLRFASQLCYDGLCVTS